MQTQYEADLQAKLDEQAATLSGIHQQAQGALEHAHTSVVAAKCQQLRDLKRDGQQLLEINSSLQKQLTNQQEKHRKENEHVKEHLANLKRLQKSLVASQKLARTHQDALQDKNRQLSAVNQLHKLSQGTVERLRDENSKLKEAAPPQRIPFTQDHSTLQREHNTLQEDYQKAERNHAKVSNKLKQAREQERRLASEITTLDLFFQWFWVSNLFEPPKKTSQWWAGTCPCRLAARRG